MMAVRIFLFGLLIISLGVISCKQEKAETAPEETPYTFNAENEFLGLGVQQFGDLDSMIARRKIRALVPYTHLYYTIDMNQRSGIAYEALNLFEQELNKQL